MARRRLQRPWERVYPRVVGERTVVRRAGAASVDHLWGALRNAPFFLHPSDRDRWTAEFRRRYPAAVSAIVAAADRAVAHEFDLLGSGCVALGPRLPWQSDFKSGRVWPQTYGPRLAYAELDRPSDIKVPWELSRCQHFTALGQAYWLTGDERYAREFADEVTDWIAGNPWTYGINWACAMDVALRAVSWIWGFYFFADSTACASPAFRGAFLRSLYMHGDFILGHLERSDVNGNHYLCDGVGLVFLGAFFKSAPRGRAWLRAGRDIVEKEIFGQTSADGVDFEKSTAYHRLVLEAFLTSGLLLRLHGDSLSHAWSERLERMMEFVEAYTKPDGTIPLIGDADDGRIQKLGTQPINDHRYLLAAGAALFDRGDFKRGAGTFGDESFWLLGPDAAARFDTLAAPAAPAASKAFHDGGYYVLRTDRAHVVVDCGEVGMLGRGGHGHSDITSFELWLDGTNLVTDCGAYLYTASREWRNAFRSTAFHNVVQIDDEELNRLVSPDHLWQLRDDARPCDVSWSWSEAADRLRCGHTGYRRLDPPVAVTREVTLLKHAATVIVRDSVEGAGDRRLVWRFHLAPGIDAAMDGIDVRMRWRGGEAWLQSPDASRLDAVTIEDGWVSPSYGVRVPARVVVARARSLPALVSWRFGVDRLSLDGLVSLSSWIPESCVNS